jgi:CheY-like chemotaxis protein
MKFKLVMFSPMNNPVRRDPILVVDDNPMNLKLVRILLASEGYEVRTASDGEEALKVLACFHPRLILMDIQLPGMDGLELTRLLKSDPAQRDIIVVALTAYAMTGDEERARKAGCEGYVTKPIDTRTLPATVNQHLGDRNAVKLAFQAGDYHDLLAELRNTFLVEGEEECGRLLRGLPRGLDIDRAKRICHRWTGIAATLGFPEIRKMASAIQDSLKNPPAEYCDGETLAIIPAGEYLSRLRSDLLEILQMFGDAVRGKRPTPAFPEAIVRTLTGKSVALIGFEPAEVARMSYALAQAQALTMAFQELPGPVLLQPIHATILNCQERGPSTRIEMEALVASDMPVLFIGSGESLLREEPGIVERTGDFLLAPWDSTEVVLRVYRLLLQSPQPAPAQPAVLQNDSIQFLQ